MWRLTPFLLVMMASAVSAEPIFQPMGLAEGDQYRLMFTTSTKRDATSEDIEDYNAFVQATADAAPVVGSWNLAWKAIASTEAVSALDNTNTNWMVEPGVPVYLVNGSKFAKGNIGVWVTPEAVDEVVALALPNINEFGVEIHSTRLDPLLVWTGHMGQGERFADAPFLGGVLGGLGFAGMDSILTIHFADAAHSENQHRFYALSEIITVVPEPSGSTALSLGGLFLALRRRVRA